MLTSTSDQATVQILLLQKELHSLGEHLLHDSYSPFFVGRHCEAPLPDRISAIFLRCRGSLWDQKILGKSCFFHLRVLKFMVSVCLFIRFLILAYRKHQQKKKEPALLLLSNSNITNETTKVVSFLPVSNGCTNDWCLPLRISIMYFVSPACSWLAKRSKRHQPLVDQVRLLSKTLEPSWRT